MVTLAGTGNTSGWLLVKATVVPPAGAVLLERTAAVMGPPPMTDEEINETPPSIGTTPSVFDCVMPPDAEMKTKVFDFCGVVEIVKFASVAPAGTVTVAGTVAA